MIHMIRAAQHRAYLHLTDEESFRLPLDIVIQCFLSLLAICYSGAMVAGEFSLIRADIQVGHLFRYELEDFRDGLQLPLVLHLRPSRKLRLAVFRPSAVQRPVSRGAMKIVVVLGLPSSPRCLSGLHLRWQPNRRFAESRSPHSLASAYEYCVDLVRRRDRETFLFHLFLPNRYRRHTLSVAAFNVELSQVFQLSSNSTTALMRLQFWKDVMVALPQGKVPEHPVAEALLHTYRTCHLSEKWLNDLVDARIDSISGQIYGDMDSLQSHFHNTFGTVLLLILQILKVMNLHADHAASHIGKAVGLVNTVRAMPMHARRGQVNLPQELLTKHGVTRDDLMKFSSAKCCDVIYYICSVAHEHMRIAQGLK
ncbi:unnamed protein product, partial [Soboliphyme baturini]|uniref:NADH dehydrogenase [ubiquinone] flavoprotein 3, mitochondrial n=1 Tax=Soboliphyme baturini TaxID=241478 RepID=A0A183IXD1_9BILA